MNNIFTVVFALTTLIQVIGQNVQVIGEDSSDVKHTTKAFDLIDKSFDLEGKTKIATLKGFALNSGNQTIVALFNSLWGAANKLGANSFYLDEVSNSGDTTFVALSLYYLDVVDAERNFNLYPKNMVYVIGDIDRKQTSKMIKLNNHKIQLNPMEYVAYQNKVGEQATVSIGGLLGAKIWIAGQEGRLPKHLSVNGLGVGPGAYNNVGVSFNTGRIYPVDINLGQFLVNVLKKQ